MTFAPSTPSVASLEKPAARRAWPKTFWFGLILILACEILLFCDVAWSNRGPVRTQEARELVVEPVGAMASTARWVAVNMTPLAWLGYIFLLDGLLVRIDGTSPIRKRPHHFALIFLASIFIWCVFDWINFYIFTPPAWTYIGTRRVDWLTRMCGYFIAFGAIVPGMLLSGQVLMSLGLFNWARAKKWNNWKMPKWGIALAFAVGVGMLIWPFMGASVANFTLWTSLVLFLDPMNYLLGRPSLLRDWERGWYGRMLAAFAGGLVCGLLWEFWNFWALTKWAYHLPFLGVTEHIKYFEMPIVGLLGFIPFGLECWVMWQSMRLGLDGLVEPLESPYELE